MKQKLKGLVLLFAIITCSVSYSQSVSDYIGTYTGKLIVDADYWGKSTEDVDRD